MIDTVNVNKRINNLVDLADGMYDYILELKDDYELLQKKSVDLESDLELLIDEASTLLDLLREK
jgi:hypothetical protein